MGISHHVIRVTISTVGTINDVKISASLADFAIYPVLGHYLLVMGMNILPNDEEDLALNHENPNL